ncbi:MAG TPA: hypothetical protein VIY53_21400 [Acidobacteriaceae bacterium]
MPGEGKYVKVDLVNVRGSAEKTLTYLKKALPLIKHRDHTVIFLGEVHTSAVDEAVTQGILNDPPVIGGTLADNRVIYERGLESKYTAHASSSFGTEREDNSDLATTTNRARSTKMAAMCLDAFENDVKIIYLPCGSKHAVEVFDDMNKKATGAFTFISKLDDASYSPK